MKPRKPTEPDADYIRRLEVANCSLREGNKRLKQWAAYESTNSTERNVVAKVLGAESPQ